MNKNKITTFLEGGFAFSPLFYIKNLIILVAFKLFLVFYIFSDHLCIQSYCIHTISLNAILEEIKLREDLNVYQLKKINGEICRQRTELMQLENLKNHYQ